MQKKSYVKKCKIFWADSGCAVKINNIKKNQCLALKPKAVWACRKFSQKTNGRICFVCREKQKSKENQKNFVCFLGESMEHQSALGFI